MGNRRAREFMIQQAEEADWEKVRTQPRPASTDIGARGIGLRRLQLLVRPSFETPSAWEIRQLRDEWRLIRPQVAATFPEMLLVGYEVVPFEYSKLAAFFERLTSLTLPLRPDLSGHGGFDGTMHELALFGDLYSEWRFKWWSNWPEQWQPLVALAEEMHAAFLSATETPA